MTTSFNIHRETLRKELHQPDKMPADFGGVFVNVPCYRFPPEWIKADFNPDTDPPALIGNFTIVVKPSPPRNGHKSSQHRVFVKCECGREVPTGRLDQHKCQHWPPPAAVAEMARLRRNVHAKHKANSMPHILEDKAVLVDAINAGLYDGDQGPEMFRQALGRKFWMGYLLDGRVGKLLETHANVADQRQRFITVIDALIESL